jgi:hypothetical protein
LKIYIVSKIVQGYECTQTVYKVLLYMEDKSSRADSDFAGGIRSGCFLGHPSLLGTWTWAWALSRFGGKKLKGQSWAIIRLGYCGMGQEDPTPSRSHGEVLPSGVGKSEKFAEDVLYGDMV